MAINTSIASILNSKQIKKTKKASAKPVHNVKKELLKSIDELDINLDDWQIEFLKTKGDKILCCGRRIGKSEISSIDAVDFALKNPKSRILMVAPSEKQAYELFSKTLTHLQTHYLKYIKVGKERPTKHKITLRNNTEILCLPTGADGTTLRGLTIHRAYIDEASRMPPNIIFSVIQPMLATTLGHIVILSTPFGAVGEFYDIVINKDGAYNSFTRFHYNSEDVFRKRKISKSWSVEQRDWALRMIDRAKSQLSNQLFQQEWMGEFADALYRYFPEIDINKACILNKSEFKAIPQDAELYLGCDFARMGEDSSSYTLLWKKPNNITYQIDNITTQKTLTTDNEAKVLELNRKYPQIKKIAIDAGSGAMGVAIYDHLLQEPEVRHKLEAVNNAKRVFDREGSRHARLLKEDLYENLRAMMQRGEIKLLYQDDIIQSLRSIQYEYVLEKGKPPRLLIYSSEIGAHGDIVESLIRSAWYAKGKYLSIWIRSIRV